MQSDGTFLRIARRVVTLAAAASAWGMAHGAWAAASCTDTALNAAPPPRALVMAAAARREHAAFGEQTMDAEGRLVRSGSAEAEANPGFARGLAPWQRVMGYWEAVDLGNDRLPSLVRFGALRPADRRLLGQALNQATSARLQGLGVGPDEGLRSDEYLALRAAIDRVAVIDTPWSAAFISWLAREAGLGPDEFVFSEAHADYAGAAMRARRDERAGTPTRYAMRACDVARTPPRMGDLICQTRASSAGLDTFAALDPILSERRTGGPGLPMHCDVVVAVDATGFDTVGGNVLQSVTSRRLDFAPGTRLLDPSYRADGCTPGMAGCLDRHMSRQPWTLLLQWR